MNAKQRAMAVCLLAVSLLISSCGPGQLFGPTLTPTPTFTPTPTVTPTPTNTPTSTSTSTPSPTPTLTPTPSPTPIPGIGTPIIINGVGIQVQSAVLGGEPPAGYTIKSGYVILSLEVAISGGNEFADLLGKANTKEFLIVDENGYESGSDYFTVPLSSLSGGTPPFSMTLIFEVQKEAHAFSLHFPDGQTIDLAPVLMSK